MPRAVRSIATISAIIILVLAASPGAEGASSETKSAEALGERAAHLERVLESRLALAAGLAQAGEDLSRLAGDARELERRHHELASLARRLAPGDEELARRIRALAGPLHNLGRAAATGLAPPLAAGSATKGSGGTVAGRVTEAATGQPLADAEVTVYDANGFFAGSSFAGGQGFYSVGGLAECVHYAVASAPGGYVSEVYDDMPCFDCEPTTGTPIPVGQGLVEGIDFALSLGGTITGTVVNGTTGGGTDADVFLYDAAGDFLRSDFVFAEPYVFESLPAGTYFVLTQNFNSLPDEVWDDIPCEPGCDPTSGTPISVELGATFTADFVLAGEPGGTIAGTLTDAETGEPLSFERVLVYDSAGEFLDSANADFDGSYFFPGLPAGSYFLRTSARFSGYLDELWDDIPCPEECEITAGTPVLVTVDAAATGIDFALEPLGTISGSVRDALTGAPTSFGGQLRIWNEDGVTVDFPFVSSSPFTSSPLLPGSYFLTTEFFQGYADALYSGFLCLGGCDPTTGTPVAVGLGEHVEGIDLLLTRLGSLAGRVTDALTGVPVAGATVMLRGGSAPQTRTTGVSGLYAFTSLGPGTYTMSAELRGTYQGELYAERPCPPAGCEDAGGATPLEVALGPGRTDIDFTLTPEGSVDPGPAVDPLACQIDVVPAATLLFPYFEVESGNPAGLTTLISLNNADSEPHVAQVTLWTDYGVPTLAFSVYLTGYDVQTINLRDILSGGILPSTGASLSNQGALSGENRSFPGCSGASAPGSTPAFPEPALSAATRAHLQAWHSGAESPMTGTCAGSPQAERWIGYVTVDAVRRCSDRTPADGGYFAEGGGGTATDENVLFGDLFLVTAEEDFAQGEPAVHLQARPEAFPPGAYTFYARHVGGDGRDGRQPLGGAWAFRYLSGGVFDGGTELLVWRDSKATASSGEVACGSEPAWAPLLNAPVLAFDEEENPQALPDELLPFPAMTQRVPVGGEELPTAADFGWLWLDLSHEAEPLFGPRAQGYVMGVMNALGRFSVGFRAVRLGDLCEPRSTE